MTVTLHRQSPALWKKWALYLVILTLIVAGWAVPIACGWWWLTGWLDPFSPWLVAVVALSPLLALVLAAGPARRLGQTLDAAEPPAVDLAVALPGRLSSPWRRGAFTLLVVMGTAGRLQTQYDSTLRLSPLGLEVPTLLVGLPCALVFGLLLISPRTPGRDLPPAAATVAWPRAVLWAVAAAGMGLVTAEYVPLLGWLSLAAALGLALAADGFSGLSWRVLRLHSRLRPAAPALVLIALTIAIVGGDVAEVIVWLGAAVATPHGYRWQGILWISGLLAVAAAGLALDNSRGARLRPTLRQAGTGLLMGLFPAVAGYWLAVEFLFPEHEYAPYRMSMEHYALIGAALMAVPALAAIWWANRHRNRFVRQLAQSAGRGRWRWLARCRAWLAAILAQGLPVPAACSLVVVVLLLFIAPIAQGQLARAAAGDVLPCLVSLGLLGAAIALTTVAGRRIRLQRRP